MLFSRIFMLSLCFLFGVSCLSAQEDVSQKGKKLLRKGRQNQKRINYEALLWLVHATSSTGGFDSVLLLFVFLLNFGTLELPPCG